ncbi:hypothetical protein SAMN05421755_10518 [Nitrosomonas sp. Nm33]|nr:hypothetical protein SAMN05421755_10518 [Nitrosomonas sp. Nm33]
MPAHRLAPGSGIVVALRRLPLHRPAEEGGDHEAGVEKHAHGRQQHREEHLQKHAQGHLEHSAVSLGPLHPDQHYAEQFGQEQQGQGGGEQCDGALRVPSRPDREELPRRQEVLRLHQLVYRQQCGGQHQEEEPQRRRQVGHHPGEKHRPVHRVHALDQEQAEVHQVAMAPAAVALELVEQVRRQFLVAAPQVVGDPYAPAGATHQRGLNEIVGKDHPGEGSLARQRCQRAVLDERLDADDRVVPPVVRLAELPEVQAGSEQRTVDAGGELLHARIKGVHARRLRRGLDDPGLGIGLHQPHQLGQTFAAHHAVGIHHHHVAILAAPAPAEVVDVAALALHPAPSPAVEDAPVAAGLAAQFEPGLLLGGGDVRRTGVAEDEEIEAVQLAAGGHRFVGRPQAGEHARHVLVADRHDNGRAGLGGNRLVAHAAAGDAVAVIPGEQFPEPHQGGPETGRDPAKEDGEEEQHTELDDIRQDLLQGLLPGLSGNFFEIDESPALIGQDVLHVPGGNGGLAHHQQQQDEPAQRADPLPARLRQVAGRLRRAEAAGEPAPDAHQHVGAPGFGDDLGAADRRRGR